MRVIFVWLVCVAPVLPHRAVVVNTWPFTNATANAWAMLTAGGSAMDAVETGCTTCEKQRCDGTVGYGGSPDEHGETTLDAMIMDAETHNVGAVGGLRGIRGAVAVARAVMRHTRHTLLVGELASQFAVEMGFSRSNLTTTESHGMHTDWLQKRCQPNFWRNVRPDPQLHCGPYKPLDSGHSRRRPASDSGADTHSWVSAQSHDTIGMLAVDNFGKMAAATSTNGAIHKIPGRVGDSPIPGAGAYVSRAVGGAAATGDGDVMMRFLPTMLAVERMRAGDSPRQACQYAINRIIAEHTDFVGALVALTVDGEHAAACHGMQHFPYSVADDQGGVRVLQVACQ